MTHKKNSRQKKPLHKTVRRSWKINPKTRVKESKKIYKRSRGKNTLEKETDNG